MRTCIVRLATLSICFGVMIDAWQAPPAAANPRTKAPGKREVRTRAEATETKKPVSISLGVPTIWTVEEAHYLLARVREGNTGLSTRTPTPEDLDPNAFNASRLQTIRSALSADVAYSQAAGKRNTMMTDQYKADSTRKRTLLAMRDRYVAQELQLEDQIAALQIDLANATAQGASDDTKKAKQAAIDARKTQLKAVQDQITATDDEISKLNATPPTFDNPGLPAQPTSGLPATAFDDIVKKLATTDFMTREPKLQSTMVLDNYIDMQYQIVSRQLKLMRDEAGREDRLIFLEVPTGIYAVPGKMLHFRGAKGDGKVVQVRWAVTRWARACDADRLTLVDAEDTFLKHFDRVPVREQECEAKIKENPDAWAWVPVVPQQKPRASAQERLRVRAIELVPQQSSINTDEFLGRSSSLSLSGIFTLLSGFGGQARYRRQHDVAQRYVTSETTTSAFGKGSNLFGWNFSQLPTDKRLAAGERTTYAALAVPRDAVGIEMHGVACYAGPHSLPPLAIASQESLPEDDGPVNRDQCVERTAVLYVAPTRDMRPYVKSLGYSTVPVGQRVTVTLHGKRLSPQIGVLVNGVELKREIALAQHSAANPAAAPAEINGVSGSFEFIDSQFMALSFSVKDAAQRPVITLVGPGFTQNLDYKTLEYYVPSIPKEQRTTCDKVALFYTPLTISALKAVAVDPVTNTLSIRLEGTSLRDREIELLNSDALTTSLNCSSDTFCRISYRFSDATRSPIVNSLQWAFSVKPGTKQRDSASVQPVEVSFDNPLLIHLDKSADPKVSWILKADGTVDKLHIELTGANLDATLTFKVDGTSQTPILTPPDKAVFEIPPPKEKAKTVKIGAFRPGTSLGDSREVKIPDRPAQPDNTQL